MSSGNKSVGRPTARERSAISAAVIELRQGLGQTQQQFAHALGVSITTIARWETNRPPRGTILADLARIARSEVKTFEIAEIFRRAILDEKMIFSGPGSNMPKPLVLALEV